MKSLFPDMEKEIRDDRKASKRERIQFARTYLKSRNVEWLINELVDNGPQTESLLMMKACEEFDEPYLVFKDIIALALIGKLWKRSAGIHPGSGEEFFVYGIRGVHPKPA